MQTDLQGKVALVCAASKGLGRAAARSLAGVNRGERIHMLTASGVRLPGRVWSGRVRYHDDRGYRFFVVSFDCTP